MNKQIIDEAAAWFVEFSAGDTDLRAKQAFDAWLRKSPEHVRVYLELLPIWDDGARPLPGDFADPDELIAWARSKDNVISLEQAAPSPAREARSSASVHSARRRAIAASLVFALLAGGLAVWLQAIRAPVYATDLGEKRSITLADGSTVELNTHSRVRVHFTAQARDVELLGGQALFRVAPDPKRPFVVTSDFMHVRAIGTQFDVYRKASGTVVTVLEGRVAIRDGSGAGGSLVTEKPVLLSAGEQARVTGAAPPAATRANVATVTAWTQGRLIFDATPLAEVAEEFNRYNARRLVVDDGALRDFHVSGSFASSDPASLLRFLKEQAGITIHETTSHIRISRE